MTVIRGTGAGLLAAGIVALEFAAAVTTFVAATLLPVIATDLGAHDRLALLLAGSTLGLFVALPVASRVVRLLGAHRTLGAGLVAYVGGLVLTATASSPWMFGAGQFASGVAGGLLAVFGIGSAIRHLDERWRVRVITASSAMWIVPALVGPAATLGLAHLVGWRWTLLAPVPVVLLGRLLVVLAVRGEQPPEAPTRPLGPTLLVPLGVSATVLAPNWWPLALAGTAVALAGVVTIMPSGTAKLRRGTPAALAAMTLFGLGYFGADSLITILLTTGYGTGLAAAAVVLSAAPLAWALTSLLVPRLMRQGKERLPAAGLGLTALAVAVLAAAPLTGSSYAVALATWTVSGIGIGLAYPGLYLRCTTAGSSGFSATELATAVITAEAFGGLLGRAVGGALGSLPGTGGLFASYALFAVTLAGAAVIALRTHS